MITLSVMKRRVPLFPLSLVLLPRMPLPLHIFEERYRLMIRRCLEEELEFGVLLSNGKTIQPLGTLARIDSVINKYDDGRMDILTVGTERIRTEDFHHDKAYLEGTVQRVADRPEPPEAVAEPARKAVAALETFAKEAGYTVDQAVIESIGYEELSFFLASTDVFSLEEKQQMLKLRSTSERLERVAKVLERQANQRRLQEGVKKLLGSDQDITHLFN